jgi:hypothetical protein
MQRWMTEPVDVVKIPRRNYMFGASLNYTGWGSEADRQARFFRKGSLRTSAEVHRFLHPVAGARVIAPPADGGAELVHFNYVSMHQFIEKLNRYTSIEAEQTDPNRMPPSQPNAAFIAAREWYRRYIVKRGYRDGWRGFYLSLAMAFYRLAVAGKHTELRSVGNEESIRATYASVAESLLIDYGAAAAARPHDAGAKS